MSLLFNKISDHHSNELPFVCFRKPNEKTIKGVFCQSDELHYTKDYTERGFVFAPFNAEESSLIFPYVSCEFLEETAAIHVEEGAKKFEVVTSDKAKHLHLVERGVEAIEEGKFKKVVLSRIEEVQIDDFQLVSVFQRMLQKYENAFVYVWYHPKVGLWLGATPERLVTLKGNEFKTMALAGTQSFEGNMKPDWGEKEQKEHQFVVDFIVSQIQKSSIEDLYVSETYTAKAGNLLHLKADISGKIKGDKLQDILHILHPTPAVCGLPKIESRDFILEEEGYSRKYYSGFLGEINITSQTELFVNLRCMEFSKTLANIYVGGGITSQSDSEKEWEETIAKTQTIKSIL
ncbi:isochorismate synthase [Pseudotenacibaculum haliotis]|uniref:isochorismate synthase n=1 Tax=Pseudotenacibaculum haliotis TaxID=1862138 RepID=A0ABW5LTA0_9FLAO